MQSSLQKLKTKKSFEMFSTFSVIGRIGIPLTLNSNGPDHYSFNEIDNNNFSFLIPISFSEVSYKLIKTLHKYRNLNAKLTVTFNL